MTYKRHSHSCEFEPIVGEPSYETLFKLETQATRHAATVVIRLPPSHTNLCGIVEQPVVYIFRVGSPLPRPPYTGDAATKELVRSEERRVL